MIFYTICSMRVRWSSGGYPREKGKRLHVLGLRWRILFEKDDTRSNRDFLNHSIRGIVRSIRIQSSSCAEFYHFTTHSLRS